eukprot:1274678-Rhodomonas_salina.3
MQTETSRQHPNSNTTVLVSRPNCACFASKLCLFRVQTVLVSRVLAFESGVAVAAIVAAITTASTAQSPGPPVAEGLSGPKREEGVDA